MSEDLKQIKQLKELAQLKLNLSLSHVAETAKEEQVPRAQLDQLDLASKEQRQFLSEQDNFMAMAALQDMNQKWAQWADDKRRKTLVELAKIAQKREAQIQQARKAFGRVDALNEIEKKLKS